MVERLIISRNARISLPYIFNTFLRILIFIYEFTLPMLPVVISKPLLVLISFGGLINLLYPLGKGLASASRLGIYSSS